MATRSKSGGFSSGSGKTGRTVRIIIGTLVVIIAGMVQQSPLVMSSPELPWPNVALWAAAGWGLTGLAIRPMLLLIAFGFAQDIQVDAPVGAFIVVNLVAFGASAFLAQRMEREVSDGMGLFYALLAILAGFIAMTLLAVAVTQSSPRLLPILGDLGVTLLLFLVLFPVFNLPSSEDGMFRGR